jgi:hypothetical protein
MILGFFEPNKKYSVEDMEKITGKQPEEATWGMQWSIWFINHGYDIKHYTTFDFAAFQAKGVEYIRETYGSEIAKWQTENSDINKAKELTAKFIKKVKVVKKRPTIMDIREAMTDKYLVKVAVNQKMLNGKVGYVGHSVVVTDVNDESVWIHDPGLPAFENKKVSLKLFQDAMDSFGGEMDAIKKV